MVAEGQTRAQDGQILWDEECVRVVEMMTLNYVVCGQRVWSLKKCRCSLGVLFSEDKMEIAFV